VADAVLEDQQRYACGEQRHDVRHQKCAPAMLVGEVAESPDVARTDSRAYCSDEKPELALPLLTRHASPPLSSAAIMTQRRKGLNPPSALLQPRSAES
jgi:hypothetical protein